MLTKPYLSGGCSMQKTSKISLFFKKAALCVTVVLLCGRLILSPATALPSVASAVCNISAEAAVLIDADSGNVLYSKNADRRMPMASTTKIMTALVALDRGELDETVEVPDGAVGIEGSSIYLVAGEKLTLRQLLYAMMLESANDAATAIAIEIGGSVDAFADMMNEKASSLGLRDTHFTNPHGLDDPNHYTTAHELAIIAACAMNDKVFREIVSTHKMTIPQDSGEGARLLVNHNKMLNLYDGAIGIKTGYTKKSGRCLVSAAERDGVRLISVTLNAPDDWQDHTNMLDLGFDCYESVTLCDEGEFRYVQHVISGESDNCVLTNTEEIKATLPHIRGEIECTVELFKFSYAPITKGDVMGYLVYTLDDREIARGQIYATHSVGAVKYESIWDRIIGFFVK